MKKNEESGGFALLCRGFIAFIALYSLLYMIFEIKNILSKPEPKRETYRVNRDHSQPITNIKESSYDNRLIIRQEEAQPRPAPRYERPVDDDRNRGRHIDDYFEEIDEDYFEDIEEYYEVIDDDYEE